MSSKMWFPIAAIEYKLPQEDVACLKEGNTFWKVRSFNKWYRRKYQLDLEKQCIYYEGSHKFPCFADPDFCIEIKDISDVRKGWKTDTFNKLGTRVQKQTVRHPEKRPLVEERCCFSIIYGHPQKTLDLVTANETLRDSWVNGLLQVVAQNQSIEQKHNHQLWVKKKFLQADRDHNKALNFQECLELLKQLNIDADVHHAKKLFLAANVTKNTLNSEQVLDEEEFLIFYQSLMYRKELSELMRRYGIQNTELMGPKELYIFALHEQKMNHITEAECKALIKGYEALNTKKSSVEDRLSLGGFRLFLLSEQQNIFNFEHHTVYQDMTKPLNHYFIASSHNTYLIGDQLLGDSSVEGYINALKSGCRCVELDVHDGDEDDDGIQEPVVYHGYTLTSKILLKEILSDGIKPYAFVASEYPLILSLEVHCSVEQQRKMAAHFRAILGDMLYWTPVSADMDKLPSPETLKNKIIIKAKTLPEDDANGYSDSETEEELDEDRSVKKSSALSIAKELSDLVVICRSAHFHSFEHNMEKGKFYDIVSLSEKRALRLIDDEAHSFVSFTNKHLVRIYPAGKRADSSNYNPIPMWNVGCQLVSLNYQTDDDKPNLLNKAKFQTNGNCGYVLKPQFMLSGSFDPKNPVDDQHKKTLILKIISGQNLPKPGQKIEGEIVDPYVVIKVRGHPDDKYKITTQTIHNNGFNPYWDESFEISIKLPELAFVHFIVRDHSSKGKDEKLGQCIIPFISIQQGYRHVTLMNDRGVPIPPASLFVHIVIKDETRH